MCYLNFHWWEQHWCKSKKKKDKVKFRQRYRYFILCVMWKMSSLVNCCIDLIHTHWDRTWYIFNFSPKKRVHLTHTLQKSRGSKQLFDVSEEHQPLFYWGPSAVLYKWYLALIVTWLSKKMSSFFFFIWFEDECFFFLFEFFYNFFNYISTKSS